MKVSEIFSSIQGEGNFIGMSATFIRFMGCNLACDFCDTKKTWDFKDSYDNLSIAEIVDEVVKLDNSLVVITGGEPCIQSELQELIDQLMSHNFYVCVETNGTLQTPVANWITCSPKAVAQYTIHKLCFANELKYVVTPDFDISAIPEGIKEAFAGHIWLQPEGSQMQEMWKKCYNLVKKDDRLRVGMQLHKLMEVE